MRSPVASHKAMSRISLEDGLTAFQCSESKGIFLPVASYFRWLAKQPERLPHLPVNENQSEIPSVDTSNVKICPESGQIMIRYKVGNDFSFYLDRSPSGSVWFDFGEWDAIRSRQFHDELHLIFTASWQNSVRTLEQRKAEALILKNRLGDELMVRLTDLKESLSDHSYRDMALAYLHKK